MKPSLRVRILVVCRVLPLVPVMWLLSVGQEAAEGVGGAAGRLFDRIEKRALRLMQEGGWE